MVADEAGLDMATSMVSAGSGAIANPQQAAPEKGMGTHPALQYSNVLRSQCISSSFILLSSRPCVGAGGTTRCTARVDCAHRRQ